MERFLDFFRPYYAGNKYLLILHPRTRRPV
jgi:hypothetical protein